ncbi:MFS transporter [Paraburkholderia unamae]|uniref:AAHS family benzoate transporter-like MFS transporter n=1 Tax=Paraburkholderia unamae TaxID=219649 RepID=A0ABX5KSK6_9BURK|nr:aromatic acid/H+ symport family MFS transporter [Paraburkholderia unamae]PVX85872.1 AAHS family benzoate transporter-like MFS transporter [Paraburkholderia unamae]
MNHNVIDDVLKDTPLNSFHVAIMFWCSMLMLFDGYDLVIYGSVLPQLMVDWKLSPVVAGVIGSSALMGMMVGALTLGSSSDRFGRKRVILACLVVFGVAALGNGFCGNATQFAACRFFTGVGLGGMVPNVVALMTEMSPSRKRNILLTVMLSFYSVGGVVAALTGKVITPAFGWRANFVVAGFPLLALPALYLWLPESISYLIARGRYTEADPILKRYAPEFRGSSSSLATPTAEGVEIQARSRMVELFARGKIIDTLLLWVAFGMCMLMVYGLNTWLPKLMAANGYSLGSSLTFLTVLNVGALFGGLFSGWLADRHGGKPTLILFFAVAALSIYLLGYRQNTFVLNLLLMCAGATTVGTLCVVHAFAAQLYPSNIRSTGVGWAAAAGRLGAIAGPALGGYLLSQQFSIGFNFTVFAIPGVVAAIASFMISGNGKKTLSDTQELVAHVD